MPGVIPVRYNGDPPHRLDLLARLKFPADPSRTTIFVASLTLERIWNALFEGRPGQAPPHQRAPEPIREGENPWRFLFQHAVRLFLDRPILTRTEERITLQRVMQAVAEDPEMARILRQDVLAWRDALALVAAEGLDLTAGVPEPHRSRLVNARVGELLRSLQGRFRALQQERNRHAYEEAAREYLAERFVPTPVVLFEGFTHFDALQRLCLDRCVRSGSTVYLLHPHREEQCYGFAVMDRVYADHLGPCTVRIETPFTSGEGALVSLQRGLFADTAAGSGPLIDDSVTLEAYSHRHQEVAACIRRIQEYLRAGARTTDIAVVMRDSYEFQALLQEEAELQGLEDAGGQPVALSIQPRLLLLTPIGRFALALYEVWEDGALRLEAEQFEAILASGWLGAHQQVTTDQFAAVKGQFFHRCRTRQEWQDALGALRTLRAQAPSGSRLPAAAVSDDAVNHWGRAIILVEALCRRLFSGPQRSIGQHIQVLLDELSRLDPDLLREREREVVERIREALLQVADATSLPMSTEEFGEVLNSLVREYEQGADQEGGETPGQIWCITPPGVDGYAKKIVFYLGVDDRRVPRRYSDPWPFASPDIDRHQETERYLFLAVASAARERLHLSYSLADEADTYRPSPYLEEAATTLGRRIQPVGPPASSGGGAGAPSRPALRAPRDRYTLADVAHFGLCPFRYKLETLDRTARAYRDATDAFQLVPLAQATWLHLALSHLERAGRSARGPANVQTMFDDTVAATEGDARRAFPGLRDLHWLTVERYVRREFRREAERAGTYDLRVVPGETAPYVLTEGDRVVQVHAPVRHALVKGLFRYPLLFDLIREEWLLLGQAPDGSQAQFSEADRVRVFASLYHAVQWWFRVSNTAYYFHQTRGQQTQFAEQKARDYALAQGEVRAWLPLIEAGHYPKNPGDHCNLCPVRGECLGL
jgi:hypothetical protein